MALIAYSPAAAAAYGTDPGALLCSALGGNVDSTNTMDRGILGGGGGVIASVAGATPSVTVNLQGSIDNVNGIAGGSMQSGFVQSDVAYWAFNGTGIYGGRRRSLCCAPPPTSIPRVFTWWPTRAPASSRAGTSRASACRSTSRARARN